MWEIGHQWDIGRDVDMGYGISIWDAVYRYDYLPYRYGHPGYRYGIWANDTADDSIDTVILRINMGYLVTLRVEAPTSGLEVVEHDHHMLRLLFARHAPRDFRDCRAVIGVALGRVLHQAVRLAIRLQCLCVEEEQWECGSESVSDWAKHQAPSQPGPVRAGTNI